jgi:hypothetical protein
MTRFSTLAIVAALTLTGAAAPALAATNVSTSGNVPLCSTGGGADLDIQKDSLAAQLQLSSKAGANIDVWNGCFKVMTTVDGKTNVAFYDPDSLKLIATL